MFRTYKCPKCGEFEEMCSMNDPIRKKCKCGEKVSQVLGGNFKLYGPGFYSTTPYKK